MLGTIGPVCPTGDLFWHTVRVRGFHMNCILVGTDSGGSSQEESREIAGLECRTVGVRSPLRTLWLCRRSYTCCTGCCCPQVFFDSSRRRAGEFTTILRCQFRASGVSTPTYSSLKHAVAHLLYSGLRRYRPIFSVHVSESDKCPKYWAQCHGL